MAEPEQKVKILLIEDDLFISDILMQALYRSGFEPIGAKNGAEGLAKFQETRPALIILDLLLPDENGLDTLRKIRRCEGGAEVKVVVLSNLSRETNFEEAKRLGVADYMVKVNFSLDEIVDKIRAVLAG